MNNKFMGYEVTEIVAKNLNKEFGIWKNMLLNAKDTEMEDVLCMVDSYFQAIVDFGFMTQETRALTRVEIRRQLLELKYQ